MIRDDDLEMQWQLCSSALHDRQHHIAKEYVGVGLAGSRRYYKASAEGLGMYGLNRVEHALGCSRIPNESGAVAFSAQVVPVMRTMSRSGQT